jgi:hypothetical protein
MLYVEEEEMIWASSFTLLSLEIQFITGLCAFMYTITIFVDLSLSLVSNYYTDHNNMV